MQASTTSCTSPRLHESLHGRTRSASTNVTCRSFGDSGWPGWQWYSLAAGEGTHGARMIAQKRVPVLGKDDAPGRAASATREARLWTCRQSAAAERACVRSEASGNAVVAGLRRNLISQPNPSGA